MKIHEACHPNGSGCVYYVEAIDTDSHKLAWVKVWDEQEIPEHVLLDCLALHARNRKHKALTVALEFNKK